VEARAVEDVRAGVGAAGHDRALIPSPSPCAGAAACRG
jgi:hypothetical protein